MMSSERFEKIGGVTDVIIVPDASVILKWVLEREDEPDCLQALRLLKAYETETIDLRLPTLWRYEAGNILGIKQPEHAGEAMKALLAYEFPEEPLGRDYCLAVLGLMRDVRGVSFYDAAYHVLAMQRRGTYVTADVEYVKKAKRKGHLALLSDWHPPAASC
nr:type II toxin-antitoxin system VapC family toxin [Nitrospirota bacterium]